MVGIALPTGGGGTVRAVLGLEGVLYCPSVRAASGELDRLVSPCQGPLLKTVYRYVLKEMLPSFLLSVSMLTLLFVINKVSLLLDLVLNKNVPIWESLLLFLSMVPFILSLTVPMSTMVATLLAFGRLSSDMEVTAFKSSGVHLFRLIGPVLLLGACLTLVMLFFNDEVLPGANFLFKKIHFKILREQAGIALQERVFIDKFEGYRLFIDRKNSDGLFSDVVMFFKWSPKSADQTAESQTGALITDPQTLQMFFQMNQGVIHWANKDYRTFNRLYFGRFTTRLNLENQLAGMTDVKKDYEEMSISELLGEMNTRRDGGRRNSLRNEFQKRLSLPFACVALTWFCAPLGLWTRSKGFVGFVLGLIMIFIYYLMFNLGQILSDRGIVSPLLGLWWANGILALAGCFIYYVVVAEHSAFRLGGGSPILLPPKRRAVP
ncbi:MAG TPA: LptF/LptG family permease [bacterium]|nr:LptF/LptG family permease [bacterium]